MHFFISSAICFFVSVSKFEHDRNRYKGQQPTQNGQPIEQIHWVDFTFAENWFSQLHQEMVARKCHSWIEYVFERDEEKFVEVMMQVSSCSHPCDVTFTRICMNLAAELTQARREAQAEREAQARREAHGRTGNIAAAVLVRR